MKYVTIITALLITFTTQAMAAETVMICNSISQVDPEKVYYKLVKPLLGEPTVQQKVKGDQTYSAKNRDILAKEMAPAAIQEAQSMARKCMSSNYKECGY